MSPIRSALVVAVLASVALGTSRTAWAEAASAATPSSGTKKPAAPAAEPVSGPQVREFQAFCDSWMQKLRDRQTYNTSHVDTPTSLAALQTGFDVQSTIATPDGPIDCRTSAGACVLLASGDNGYYTGPGQPIPNSASADLTFAP